jgi:hypothetical protein
MDGALLEKRSFVPVDNLIYTGYPTGKNYLVQM